MLYTLTGLSSNYDSFIVSVPTSKTPPTFLELHDMLISKKETPENACIFSVLIKLKFSSLLLLLNVHRAMDLIIIIEEAPLLIMDENAPQISVILIKHLSCLMVPLKFVFANFVGNNIPPPDNAGI